MKIEFDNLPNIETTVYSQIFAEQPVLEPAANSESNPVSYALDNPLAVTALLAGAVIVGKALRGINAANARASRDKTDNSRSSM